MLFKEIHLKIELRLYHFALHLLQSLFFLLINDMRGNKTTNGNKWVSTSQLSNQKTKF